MPKFFDKPDLDLSGKRIIAVFTAYNEADRIPFFLEYYRRLGVAHFLAIDNNSTDNTRELLQGQPDVSYFHTTGSYVASKAGRLWTSELANHYCKDRWCLTLDLDEQLVYPGSESVGLNELCDYLDEHGYDGIFTVFLDMYSAGPLSEAVYTPGQPYLEVCDHFEVATYTLRQPMYFPHVGVFGGPRQRIFWEQGKRGNGPSARKLPLIRWREGFKYFYSTHSSKAVRLADVTGALLHFKFFSHFSAFAQRELARGDRVQTADYENYVRLSKEQNLVFANEYSIRYDSSATLVQHGVAVCTRRYLGWLRPRLTQSLGNTAARKLDQRLRESMKTALDQAVLKLEQLPLIWSLLGSATDGAVLAVQDRSILGWFLDRGAREPVQRVEARVGERVVAAADTSHAIWEHAMIDPDYCESLFQLSIPEAEFHDDGPLRVSLCAAGDSAAFASVQLYRPEAMAAAAEYEGACHLNEQRIGGWAWSPADPGRSLLVSLHVDGQYWRSVPADDFRQNLLDRGIGKGAHGFSVELPSWLDPAVPHVVHVSVQGTNLQLRRSPLLIPVRQRALAALPDAEAEAPAEGGVAGAVVAVRHGRIYGWAADRTDPSKVLRVELVVDGRVQRVASAYRAWIDDDTPAAPLRQRGFQIEAFAPWEAPFRRTPRVLALRVAGSGRQLASLAVAPPRLRIDDSEYRGYCDPGDAGVVRGWVWRPQQPAQKVDVAVFVDGLPFRRVTADRYREDLRQHNIGDGWHGFTVDLPKRVLDNGEHAVDVVVADCGVALANGHMTVSGRRLRTRSGGAGRRAPGLSPRALLRGSST